MASVGIDFGNKNCVIAVARKNGVDIVDNEASNRATPAVISMGEKERFIGEPGSVNLLRNLPNSVYNVKRLLGRTHADPDPHWSRELSRLACQVSEHPTLKTPVLTVNRTQIVPEQAAAMLLVKLKQTTEREIGTPVRDVVITVPAFWGERQRRALLDAAEIAGLRVLRLVNDHLAVAVGWGIVKQDLPETDGKKVLFVDMGHSATTASVASFTKAKATVLAVAYDPELGGRDFDEVVAEHLAQEASKKLGGGDVRKSARQWARLLTATEKQVKRAISAGTPKATVGVDNLMNDRDFAAHVTKEQFVELTAHLVERAMAPVEQALAAAGIKKGDLAAVEIMGGGMRLPVLQERLAQAAGCAINKTLNQEEAAARGAAWVSAMMSPLFKVREFKVEDITSHPIRISWHTVGEDAMDESGNSAIIIPKNAFIPSPKVVTFNRSQAVEFVASYDDPATCPGAPADPWIGTYTIAQIPATIKAGEIPKLKIRANLDLNGTFAVEDAETLEVVEETVEVDDVPAKVPPPPPSPVPPSTTSTEPKVSSPSPAPATSPSPAPEAKPAETTTGTGAPAPEAQAAAPAPETAAPAPAAAATPEKPKKRTEVRKKTVKKDVVVKKKMVGLPRSEVTRFLEIEALMQAADKLCVETAEAKNRVESYAYNMQDKFERTDLPKYGLPADVKSLQDLLSKTRTWLYEDGESETKGVYDLKLKEMQALGEPMVRRRQEAEARPAAVSQLESATQQMMAWSQTKEEKFAHIDETERKKVAVRCNETTSWLAAQNAEQGKKQLHEDPVFTAVSLGAKKADLVAFCTPIMSRPKPPPPPPPKPAEPEKKDQQAQPASAAPASDAKVPPPMPDAQGSSPSVPPMDVDQQGTAPSKAAPAPMDVETPK